MKRLLYGGLLLLASGSVSEVEAETDDADGSHVLPPGFILRVGVGGSFFEASAKREDKGWRAVTTPRASTNREADTLFAEFDNLGFDTTNVQADFDAAGDHYCSRGDKAGRSQRPVDKGLTGCKFGAGIGWRLPVARPVYLEFVADAAGGPSKDYAKDEFRVHGNAAILGAGVRIGWAGCGYGIAIGTGVIGTRASTGHPGTMKNSNLVGPYAEIALTKQLTAGWGVETSIRYAWLTGIKHDAADYRWEMKSTSGYENVIITENYASKTTCRYADARLAITWTPRRP